MPQEIDHWDVIGPTKCGKSNLVKWYAQERRLRGVPVLLCDPIGDPAWRRYADWITQDPHALLHKARRSTGCVLVLDEAAQYLTNHASAHDLKWFATQSRHLGHQAIFMSQKATAIQPVYRGNAGTLFLFGCTMAEAETCAEDFVDPALCHAVDLPRFHYLEKTRFAPIRLGTTPRMAAGVRKRCNPHEKDRQP